MVVVPLIGELKELPGLWMYRDVKVQFFEVQGRYYLSLLKHLHRNSILNLLFLTQ